MAMEGCCKCDEGSIATPKIADLLVRVDVGQADAVEGDPCEATLPLGVDDPLAAATGWGDGQVLPDRQ